MKYTHLLTISNENGKTWKTSCFVCIFLSFTPIFKFLIVKKKIYLLNCIQKRAFHPIGDYYGVIIIIHKMNYRIALTLIQSLILDI